MINSQDPKEGRFLSLGFIAIKGAGCGLEVINDMYYMNKEVPSLIFMLRFRNPTQRVLTVYGRGRATEHTYCPACLFMYVHVVSHLPHFLGLIVICAGLLGILV